MLDGASLIVTCVAAGLVADFMLGTALNSWVYQRIYEKRFVKEYRSYIDTSTEIPLTLSSERTKNLLAVCRRYYRHNSLRVMWNRWWSHGDPDVGSYYLAFRRIRYPPAPVAIRAIRCSDKFAMIRTKSGGKNGYILIRSKTQYKTYYIYAKFRFREKRGY